MSQAGVGQADLVMLVDDDPEIRQLIGDFLDQHGFRVASAGNSVEMDRQIAAERPALIVLDLMLPGEDGLAICRRLSATQIPVIMLSALGQETDRIVGLELGADDYLAKPCSPRELLARIRAVLRRHESAQPAAAGFYHFAGWSFDPRRRELRSPDGITVALSSGEFRLLSAFLERPLRVLSRDQLIEVARGPTSDVFDRAIDVQVSRLRKKLADHGGADLIATVRSEGYMFAVKPVLR
ncbi:response regulator [Sphingomonas sinipercae]|uniref:Regulatory protein VirG n=1 Tax=Sphingomonas sinipercae TaxID=2714944 RepID=A0A6G7ZM27_9SPHN|nr:response regulator [Sphingomonas sinipercae]QIL01970.1 response regulator [Sphingomonas sinipercae]